MARNARAHIEPIVAGDPEIQEEYEALRLRRAIVAQLRALRERKRWTQQQLADAAGMPRSAIARLESAEHSSRLETLHAVAHVLGYDVDVRFAGERRSPERGIGRGGDRRTCRHNDDRAKLLSTPRAVYFTAIWPGCWQSRSPG